MVFNSKLIEIGSDNLPIKTNLPKMGAHLFH